MNNNILKGKLIRWNDKKGFGFIKPELGNRDIFIHISSLKNMPRKPIVGDIIFYQIHTDNNGKQRAVNSKIQGLKIPKNQTRTNNINVVRKTNQKSKISTLIFTVLIFVFIGTYVFSFLSKQNRYKNENIFNTSSQHSEIETYDSQYSCSGKTYCSEMNSCEEATFYLRNCPNTKLDGNHDGVPCERQCCN